MKSQKKQNGGEQAASNSAQSFTSADVMELTGEDTMKRVVLLPLLLMLAGCVTYEGVDQNGRRSKFGNLIECRQSSIACRRVPQNPKDQASDIYNLSDTYMLFPK